jgi:hypothetical protein
MTGSTDPRGQIGKPLKADEVATWIGPRDVGYPTTAQRSWARGRGYHADVLKAPLVICTAVLAVSIVALAISRSWWMLIAVAASACCLTVVYGMYQRGRE